MPKKLPLGLELLNKQTLQDMLQSGQYSKNDQHTIQYFIEQLDEVEPETQKQEVQHDYYAQLKKQIEQLTPKQVDDHIRKTLEYESTFDVLFFRRYIKEILQYHEKKALVKFTFASLLGNSRQELYPIKPALIQQIIDISKGYTEEEENQGSDKSAVLNLFSATKAEIIPLYNYFNATQKEQKYFDKLLEDTPITVQPAVKNTKSQGAYFNFLNTIQSLDLTQQQISKDLETHRQISKTNCFIYSLQQSGFYTEDEMTNIISQVQLEQEFSMRQIKKIQGFGPMKITKYSEQRSETYDIGDTKQKYVQLGLYHDHFFFDCEINVSANWIKKYKEYKDDPKFIATQDLIQVRAQNKGYRKGAEPVRVGKIIVEMMQQGLFEEIKEFTYFNYKELSKKVISAPNKAETYIKETEQKDPAAPFDLVYFADFETFTVDDSGNNIPHDPFLLCYCSYDYENISSIKTARNITSLYRDIANRTYKNDNPKVLTYFHNLDYDSSFILHNRFDIQDIIIANGRVIQFNVFVSSYVEKKRIQITFRDSNRLFAKKLSELPKMLLSKDEQARIYKEIFPYQYYTKSRYINNIGTISEALKDINRLALEQTTREDLVQSIRNGGAYIDEDTFNMQAYCEYYCKQDVLVLAKCLIKFREAVQLEFCLDVFSFISISSLAIKYQINKGCFKESQKVFGPLRQFFQQFIIGGRTMCRNNQKHKCYKSLQDFDAVSLYPSAMKRVWYPTGKCYTLTSELINYYNIPENLFKITEDINSEDQRTLYVEVKITKQSSTIDRGFPLLSAKNDDGIRMFENQPQEHTYFYDVIGLQDLIKFQKYSYEIISGVYFEERNYQIQETIEYMFNQRVSYKKKGNNIQEVYKLMLNSSYGKTCEGLHPTKTKLLSESEYKKYVARNFNIVDSINQIGEKYIIQELVEVQNDESWNYIGSLILSMSKRLMNEVICLAEDMNINIYYQDTDSMHIETQSIEPLSKAFEERYNRALIGSAMGQFHTDFDSGRKGWEVKESCKSIFLGKKCYIDVLTICKDGQYDVAYHIRMKGVSEASIERRCEELGLTPYELYKLLYSSQEGVEFDLASVKVCFDKTTNMIPITLDEFKRVLCFV